MNAGIEDQGIVKKGTLDLDLDLWKIRAQLMKERMRAENIVMLKGLAQNLMKESVTLKINQMESKIRKQGIGIEGVQGQDLLIVSMKKEAHPMEILMRPVLNTQNTTNQNHPRESIALMEGEMKI